ncbi:MAG TPA: hypothetical protein PKW07_01775 [Syntrophorhabdaceae bacterium]|nr:hypothetical protein [Syntrophorhabdaceae bacterium]
MAIIIKNLFLPVFSSLLLSVQPCFGYLDFGSGSYFIQIIIGFILAGLFFLRYHFKRFINMFRKNKRDEYKDK